MNKKCLLLSVKISLFSAVLLIVGACKTADTDPAAYAPSDLGTIERLEDEVCDVYQTSYVPENKEIIYSKFKYDTKELIEKVTYDSDTGEIK